jgi:hypothetical protein
LGQLMRRVTIAALVAAGIVLALFLTKALERLVDGLMLRVGSVWTLGIVAAATLVLGVMWLGYGGARVVKWWGIVLKPARPEEEAADTDTGSERRPPLVGPRR